MKQTWLGLCVLMAACSPTPQGSGDTDTSNEGTAPQTIEDPCAFGACDSDPEPVIDDEEWRVLGLISATYANGMFTFSSANDDGCTDCIESAGVKPVRVAASTVGYPYRPDGKGGLQSTPLSEISWTHSKSLSNRYAYAFLEVVDDPENAFPQQFHTFGTEDSVLDVPYRSHPDAPNLRNPLLPLSSGENPLYFWRDIDQFSVTFALKARVADCSDSEAGMQCSPPGAACDTDADCARGTCVDTEEGGVCGSVMPEDTCNPCTDYCPGTLNVARQFGFNAVSPEDVSFDGRYWQYAFEDDAVATADDVEAALRPKLEAHIGETWNPEVPLLHVRELFGTDWPESLTLEAYLSMEQAAEQDIAPRHAAWKRFSKHAGQQAFEPGQSRYFLPENVYFIDRLARENNVSTLTSDIDGSEYSGPTGNGDWVMSGGRFKGLHQVSIDGCDATLEVGAKKETRWGINRSNRAILLDIPVTPFAFSVSRDVTLSALYMDGNADRVSGPEDCGDVNCLGSDKATDLVQTGVSRRITLKDLDIHHSLGAGLEIGNGKVYPTGIRSSNVSTPHTYETKGRCDSTGADAECAEPSMCTSLRDVHRWPESDMPRELCGDDVETERVSKFEYRLNAIGKHIGRVSDLDNVLTDIQSQYNSYHGLVVGSNRALTIEGTGACALDDDRCDCEYSFNGFTHTEGSTAGTLSSIRYSGLVATTAHLGIDIEPSSGSGSDVLPGETIIRSCRMANNMHSNLSAGVGTDWYHGMILEDNVIADYGYDMDVDANKQGRKLNRASLNLKALQCAEEDCDYALTVSGNTIVGVGRPPIVLGAQEAAFDTLEEIPSTFDIDNDCYVFTRDNTYRCRYAHGGVLMENNNVVAIGETFISTFHGLFSKQTLSGAMDIIDNRFILDASAPGTVDSCSDEYVFIEYASTLEDNTMYTNGTEVRVGEDVEVDSGNALVTYSGLSHNSTSTNCANDSVDTPDGWSFDDSETNAPPFETLPLWSGWVYSMP